MSNNNVHKNHCCQSHGCKYGDADCPVVSGQVLQAFPCELCEEYSYTGQYLPSKINPQTMLIENFGSINLQLFWNSLVKFMYSGTPADGGYMHQIFRHWTDECGLSESQFIISLSTLFPLRMMESLIRAGFQLKEDK